MSKNWTSRCAATILIVTVICFSRAPLWAGQQETSVEAKSDAAESPDSPEGVVSSAALEELLLGKNPQSVAELRAMQHHFQELAEKVRPATVSIQLPTAQGSGVIVSRDGYVLTAAHVIGSANRPATITMPDGTELEARTLGCNRQIDSGLLKITSQGDWPYLDIGESGVLQPGQWVMAIGHPGGFDRDRTPVIRVGRVLSNTNRAVQTDCTLVGGDSGGPLVDMNGDVIGIHSRIGGSLTSNVHVPVDTYTETWDDLADGKVWGSGIGGRSTPRIGLSLEDLSGNRVSSVAEDGPAAQAGIQPGDLIIQFDGDAIRNGTDLRIALLQHLPGDTVIVKVKRGDEELDLQLTIATE